MLRFQANSRTEIIDNPLFAGQCAVQEVTTINLYAGLVGVNIQNDACSGRFECGTYFIYVSLSIQHPVVVDAISILQLCEVLVDVGTYGSRLSEIHGSTFNACYFAGRHEGAVHRSIMVGVQGQQLT